MKLANDSTCERSVDEHNIRICLGRHLADASLFINIASILHVFSITPPLNADGQPEKVEVKMSTGFLS